MGNSRNRGFFLARICVGAIFYFALVKTYLCWDGVLKSLEEQMELWQMTICQTQCLDRFFDFLFSNSFSLLFLGTSLELLGAFLLLFRKSASFGAGCLILFLTLVTLLYYPFWLEVGPEAEIAATKFFLNLAILGGLLAIALYPKPLPSVR